MINREEEKRSPTKRTLNDFIPIQVIGEGSYGRVLLVRRKANSQNQDSHRLYALKTVNKEKVKKIDPKLQSVDNEKLIL